MTSKQITGLPAYKHVHTLNFTHENFSKLASQRLVGLQDKGFIYLVSRSLSQGLLTAKVITVFLSVAGWLFSKAPAL